ncbi:hypothetical protein MALU111345_16215 [Marinicrinis lubricantis]
MSHMLGNLYKIRVGQGFILTDRFYFCRSFEHERKPPKHIVLFNTCQMLFICVPIFSSASLVLSMTLGSFGTCSLSLLSEIIEDWLLFVFICRCLLLRTLFAIFFSFAMPSLGIPIFCNKYYLYFRFSHPSCISLFGHSFGFG